MPEFDVSDELRERQHAQCSESKIVEATFVTGTYIMVSKFGFGDALGAEIESVFDGVNPVLQVDLQVRAAVAPGKHGLHAARCGQL